MFQYLDKAGIPALELIEYHRGIDIDNIVIPLCVYGRLSGNEVVVLALTDWVSDYEVCTPDPTTKESARTKII